MTTSGQTIPSTGQLTGDFDNSTSTFTGQFLPSGGSAIPLQGTFEMLTAP